MEHEINDAERSNTLRDLPECAFLYEIPLEIPITDDDFVKPDLTVLQYQAVVSDLAIFGDMPDSYWDLVPDWLRYSLKYGDGRFNELSKESKGACVSLRNDVMGKLHERFGVPTTDPLFPHVKLVMELPREKWPFQYRYWNKRLLNQALDTLRIHLFTKTHTHQDWANCFRSMRNRVPIAQDEIGVPRREHRNIRIPSPRNPLPSET